MFQRPISFTVSSLSVSLTCGSYIISQLLLQGQACLSAPMFAAMTVLDSPSEAVIKPLTKHFVYKLSWSWLSLHSNRKVRQEVNVRTTSQ